MLALGVTAVFGQFSGFESAAVLGEETRRSTAITWSPADAVAIYIFFTCIVYSAYPSPAGRTEAALAGS